MSSSEQQQKQQSQQYSQRLVCQPNRFYKTDLPEQHLEQTSNHQMNVLNFTANPSYRRWFHVGWFTNELIRRPREYCLLPSRAKQLHFLADALKAHFRLYLPHQPVTGTRNRTTGQWNGMMRLFQLRLIDFAFNDFSLVADRTLVARYSTPIKLNYRLAILSRRTYHQPNLEVVFAIFDWPVWITVVGFGLLLLTVLALHYHIRDLAKVVLELFGIFLGVGSVVDPSAPQPAFPRPVFAVWLISTLVITFILRNEILAHFNARHVDPVDTIADVRDRHLKVLVQTGSEQIPVLRSEGLPQKRLIPISWADQWSPKTMDLVLTGRYVLILKEDNLDAMISVHRGHPLRISEEKRDLKFEYYLYRKDIDRRLEQRLNRCISILQTSGVYEYLKMNSFREYTVRKKQQQNQASLGKSPASVPDSTGDDPDDVQRLRLEAIDDFFFGLLYGWLLATAVCLAELVTARTIGFGFG